MFPSFQSERKMTGITRIPLGLIYYNGEVFDFTDGTGGEYVVKQVLMNNPMRLSDTYDSNRGFCFEMVRNYNLQKGK